MIRRQNDRQMFPNHSHVLRQIVPVIIEGCKHTWRVGHLPGQWPDGGLSEGYGHGEPGVCLGDGQTEAYLKDTGMTGLAPAWAMDRRSPI